MTAGDAALLLATSLNLYSQNSNAAGRAHVLAMYKLVQARMADANLIGPDKEPDLGSCADEAGAEPNGTTEDGPPPFRPSLHLVD